MRSIIAALCLLFFLLAFALFYHWNIPVQRIVVHLTPLLISLLFVFSICGLGWPLARLLASEQEKWIQALASVAFGLGVNGIFNFLIGFLAHYTWLVFAIWSLTGLFLFAVAFARWRPLKFSAPAKTPWNIFSISVFALFFIGIIPFVVAPEVSTDAVTYHLLLPKLYLASGELRFLPLFAEASYPSLAELNYISILGLADPIVCKCFHFWIGVLLLIILSRIVRKISPASGPLLAPALFLSMPVAAIHLGWAWNDFIYSLFVLLSLYFFLHYDLTEPAQRTSRHLLVAGLFAGLASWTKYTFVIYFLTTLLLLLWGARERKWDSKQFPFYFLGIALIAPFWLFQNWKFTGNPVYPFLNHIFQSPYWTENSNQFFVHHLRRYEIQDWNWKTYFFFPAKITLNPRIIETHTGILAFAFLPLLLLRTASRGIGVLKAYIVSCILVWLVIQTETRSILTVFAALFCIASIALQEEFWRWKFFKPAVITMMSAAIALNFFVMLITTEHLFDPVDYFVGIESTQRYISRMGQAQQAYDFLNSNPQVRRVMLVSLHGPFYLGQPVLFSDYTDPPIAEVLLQDTSTPEEVAAKFRRLGITHIVINPGSYKEENDLHLYSWSQEQRIRFETFLRKYCNEVGRFPNAIVLQLK